jgi:hypothetical protein
MYTKENSVVIFNNLNDYIINITTDLLKKIKETIIYLGMRNIYFLNKPLFDNFHNINKREIINYVIELKNGSSPGINRITIKIISLFLL